jgi:hypothetical protein
MVMTQTERIARLESQVAKLTHLVEEKLSPPPAPRVPEKPPWAGSGENTGASWSGPPSVPQHAADGISWVKERKENGDWRDVSGHWRDSSGQLIVKPIEPRPAGPERTTAHAEAVQLLDRIVETTPLKE